MIGSAAAQSLTVNVGWIVIRVYLLIFAAKSLAVMGAENMPNVPLVAAS